MTIRSDWWAAIRLVSVTVGPGSTISARPIRPGDVDTMQNPVVMLMTGSLIVEEPGKQPVAYDPMRTLILVRSAKGPARRHRERALVSWP